MTAVYNPQIYSQMREPSRTAARKIVPMILDLLPVSSVADLGCGTGEWLTAFKERGAKQLLGVDGGWVDRSLLSVSEDEFRVHDLSRPFQTAQKFDLAVCLEVVGHIPEQNSHVIVKSLVDLAPVVLFSAPAPHQNPVGHLPANNQWPAYWAAHFKKHGYEPVDALRRAVWDDPEVEYYYSQNIFLYASKEALAQNPRLAEEHRRGQGKALSLIHPVLYTEKTSCEDLGFMGRFREAAKLLLQLPSAGIRAIRRRKP